MIRPTPHDPRRTVVLVLVLAAVAAFAAAGPAVGSTTDVGEATRTIDETEVTGGDSIEVEIEVTVAGDGARLTITELPSPALEEVTVSDGGLQYNGEAVEPSLTVVENDVVIVGLAPEGGFESGDTVRLVYTATVPGDAGDGVVEFDGEAAIDDQAEVTISGEDRVTVAAVDDSDREGGETTTDSEREDDETTTDPSETGDGGGVGTPGLGIVPALLALLILLLVARRKRGDGGRS